MICLPPADAVTYKNAHARFHATTSHAPRRRQQRPPLFSPIYQHDANADDSHAIPYAATRGAAEITVCRRCRRRHFTAAAASHYTTRSSRTLVRRAAAFFFLRRFRCYRRHGSILTPPLSRRPRPAVIVLHTCRTLSLQRCAAARLGAPSVCRHRVAIFARPPP